MWLRLDPENDCNTFTVDRGVLAGLLAHEATKRYPDGRIRIHFNALLTDLDLDARRASFSMQQSLDKDGQAGASSSGSVEAKYDLLIGADGAGSK